MAEYYDESRNEGPNILGMAGLLGLGALAGAGGYYALRNTRGKNAAAEALTRSARSERPRGVQMTDLGARRTGDFGLVDIPPSRSTRITGDRGVIQSPIANDIVTDLPEVVASAPRERMVRRHGRMVPLSSLQSQVAPHASEQYSNVPPSVPPTTPTSELRSQVYANVAAKPESELPSVYKPQGGTTEEMLITDPNTGEIYRRGGGGSYFASKAAELAGNVLTDLPEAVASAPRERMVRRQGRMVPLSSLQQKQPAIPTATVDLSIGDDLRDDIAFIKQVELDEAERYSATSEAQAEMRRATRAVQNIEGVEKARAKNMLLDFRRELENNNLKSQATDAVESGAAQQTGRTWQQLSRNEDLDKTQIAQLEAQADADFKAMLGSNPSEWSGVEGDVAINTIAQVLPDGLPVDQAEGVTVRDLVSQGKPVLDLRQRQAVRISPRALGLEQEQDPLTQEALQYLRAKEIDTDFDYSAENMRQAAQVRDRVERAQALQNEANQILAGLQAKGPVINEQLSPQEFAASFNKKYREELNPELQLVDNSRQRQELRGAQTGVKGEDVVSLLLGDVPEVESTMRGKALRGGKLNRAGDISYMDESGQEYASADTGVKARQGQGVQYKEQVLLTNEVKPIIGRASDEELTSLLLEGQESPLRQALKERVTQKFTRYQDPGQLNLPLNLEGGEQQAISTSLDTYLTNLASQTLVARALKNPEPTALQTAALNRARASVAASEEIRQQARIQSQQKPTIAPGPAQDLARSMETLRRGMIVEPSEPLPVLPSIQQMRAGFVTDVDPDELKKMTKAERVQLLGPVVSASDVYTGAAAEAAGPVIFTGKSKANSVLAAPPITGSIGTPTGRYLTQDNPDVLGTVYNVAGTPANRAISRQVEANAQAFLADAITGGMQAKAISDPESYVTPRGSVTSQLELFPAEAPQVSSISPMRLAGTLGSPGIDPSKRTLYAQYQPGRSVPVPRSPFIGEMTGGTVVVVPPTGASTGTRRDIGALSASIDLTRRGENSKYFSLYPEEQFVTGLEPAPIGPLTQSPGLSRIGGMAQQTVQGAGGLPVTQLTPQGQRIAYPRMDKPAKALGLRGETITNVPRYGINPGAEDWRDDLMRSAYRRGGPIRTSPADPRQLGIEGRGLELLLEYLNTGKP
jgi:hypothetical protein